MKNILVLVHDDAAQDARLQAALDITRAVRGHLTCLDVTILPNVGGELYTVSPEAQLLTGEREREGANRQRVLARLAREDVPWTWVDVTGTLAGALDAAAKTADLIIVSRQLDSTSFPDMRAAASELVVSSGKAVLAVPEHAKGFRAAGRALVAWDGSDEAMKALQAAVPLLQLAQDVVLLEIDDGSVTTPGEEAAAYLSRHGVSPDLIRLPDAPAGDMIMAQARTYGADYVVMGGFGHSRVLEAVLGGASRELLTRSPVPTLMSH